MNLKQSIPTLCIALGLAASTSCNEKNLQEVQNTSAQAVVDTLSHDWMSVPENENLFRLYQLLDRGEKTTDYFQKLCAYYDSQGKDHELSLRLADVMARVLTLRDLVETKTINPLELRVILENNIVISGIHEANQQPPITAKLKGDIAKFFDGLTPSTEFGVVLNDNEKLTLSHGDESLELLISDG